MPETKTIEKNAIVVTNKSLPRRCRAGMFFNKGKHVFVDGKYRTAAGETETISEKQYAAIDADPYLSIKKTVVQVPVKDKSKPAIDDGGGENTVESLEKLTKDDLIGVINKKKIDHSDFDLIKCKKSELIELILTAPENTPPE